MPTVPDPAPSADATAGGKANLKVSAYDAVASWLVALLVLVGATVGALFIVWLTSRLLFRQTPVPVELVEYSGRGDHEAGFARDKELDEPNVEELEEMVEPQVETALEMVTEVVTTELASFDKMMTDVASGTGSGLGDSRQAGPEGEGRDDVVPPWERWEIRFSTTGLQVYARQLDFFKIELGAIGGGSTEVDYVYNVSKGKPDRRSGKPDEEQRLYMTWKDGKSPIAVFDQQLVQRAGINTQRRVVLQFLPKDVEKQLMVIEATAGKGRDPRAYLKTIFGVREVRSGGYEFFVIDQFFRPVPRS